MADCEGQKLKFGATPNDMQEKVCYENITPPDVILRDDGNLVWTFKDKYLDIVADCEGQKLKFGVTPNDMQEKVCYENITPPDVILRDDGNLVWTFKDKYLDIVNEICAECNNYFSRGSDRHFGKFVIKSGELSPIEFIKPGQYYRIVGSMFNDGVYQDTSMDLIDEEFDGAVWAMNVPPAVIAIAQEVLEYQKEAGNKPSPYISESFGGYSYTKATNSKGILAGWLDVFGSRLNMWRRIRVL